MTQTNVNVDFCGIIFLLRQLVQSGNCTEKEAKNIASRIAVKMGADIIISL